MFSLGISAVLSALVADVELATFKGKFFFVLVPPITTAAIVGYFFVRETRNRSANAVADAILDEMPKLAEVSEEEE